MFSLEVVNTDDIHGNHAGQTLQRAPDCRIFVAVARIDDDRKAMVNRFAALNADVLLQQSERAVAQAFIGTQRQNQATHRHHIPPLDGV